MLFYTLFGFDSSGSSSGVFRGVVSFGSPSSSALLPAEISLGLSAKSYKRSPCSLKSLHLFKERRAWTKIKAAGKIVELPDTTTTLVTILGTLHCFAEKWTLSSPPPPHPQFNVDFKPPRLAPICQHWFWGKADLEKWILPSHFKTLYQ